MFVKLFVFIAVFACVQIASANLLEDVLSGYKFYDLSFPYDNNTVYWPDVQKYENIKQTALYVESKGYWFASNEYMSGEHIGTHIDAPYHFNQYGLRVGQLDINKLIVPMEIVDISHLVNDDPDFVLYRHHLPEVLVVTERPVFLVFKFGWSKFFNNRTHYLGLDPTEEYLRFPGIGVDVAQWILDSYPNVVGVGVDVCSLDPGANVFYPVHQTLLGANLFQVENIDLTNYVPVKGCVALILPMKIAEGTGAPLRLIAVCPKKINTITNNLRIKC